MKKVLSIAVLVSLGFLPQYAEAGCCRVEKCRVGLVRHLIQKVSNHRSSCNMVTCAPVCDPVPNCGPVCTPVCDPIGPAYPETSVPVEAPLVEPASPSVLEPVPSEV